jgi:hypothetical protein
MGCRILSDGGLLGDVKIIRCLLTVRPNAPIPKAKERDFFGKERIDCLGKYKRYLTRPLAINGKHIDAKASMDFVTHLCHAHQ